MSPNNGVKEMALSVSVIGKDEFWDKVLTASRLLMRQKLLDLGVKFTTELYTIKAEKDSKVWQVNLPVVVTTLLKFGEKTPPVELAETMVNQFISKLYDVLCDEPVDTMPPGLKKANPVGATSLGELLKAKLATSMNNVKEEKGAEASFTAESMQNPEPAPEVPSPHNHKTFPEKKVKPGVIPLVEAETVGQKVRGTSSGSVYRAIALNKRVKLAARIKGSAVSLRVECNNATDEELTAIKSVVQWHGSYGSTHFEAGSIPMKRVLGAVIYGLGVKFDEVLKVGEDVQNGV